VKIPQWLAAEVAGQGALVLTGETARGAAEAEIAAEIGRHPECVAELVAADAGRELSAWIKAATPVTGPPAQLSLFPGLAPRMKVAPTRYADVIDMDAGQLDHARNMLMAGEDTAAAAERCAGPWRDPGVLRERLDGLRGRPERAA